MDQALIGLFANLDRIRSQGGTSAPHNRASEADGMGHRTGRLVEYATTEHIVTNAYPPPW